MRGKVWTPEDDYICMSEDLSTKEKAGLLDRSINAVYNHRIRMEKYGDNYKEKWALVCRERAESKGANDKTRTRRYKAWEPTEDDYILSHPNITDNEIGLELGRSECAVRTRRWKLLRRMWG